MRRPRSENSSSLTVQLALPPPTPKQGYNVPYRANHRLNDDILIGIFNCYRLDNRRDWNRRLLWCKLSHVCQRWRHLIYESTFHLRMFIECSNKCPVILDTLDHLPPLPLSVSYRGGINTPTSEQELYDLRIYHPLRLPGRLFHIDLTLYPSMMDEVVILMDEHFPILKHLSLSYSYPDNPARTLPNFPKGFLAPNLRHLSIPNISPPRRLRFLTSTVSLVTLKLRNIQASSYVRPRVLAARLGSLPLLEELFIGFSIPITCPSTERELLGEQRTPVTLPSLKILRFYGVGAYLESLVAHIRVPLLEQVVIGLFNQVAFVLPHLCYLINITEVFMLSRARVSFHYDEVCVVGSTSAHGLGRSVPKPFYLRVTCKPLYWQIDCAAQICHALIPTLSGVEELTLYARQEIPTELQNRAIDSTTWHDLLRSFIGVKELYIYLVPAVLLEGLSRALQVDGVGSDPGFLPNLRSIHAKDNRFTSFIDTRQAVGRPVEFQLEEAPWSLVSSLSRRSSSTVASL